MNGRHNAKYSEASDVVGFPLGNRLGWVRAGEAIHRYKGGASIAHVILINRGIVDPSCDSLTHTLHFQLFLDLALTCRLKVTVAGLIALSCDG